MTTTVLNRTFKGLADLKLKRLTDNAILHLPVPDSFKVENNVEQKIQYTRTAQGERARASTFVSGREPVLTVTYSFMQPETLQFRIGNEFEQKTDTLKVAKSYTVTESEFPATTTGKLGFNVVEDATAQAAITRDNVSFQLNQVPFSSFDGNTDDTFAVGAALNIKFSDNLVTAQETVSLTFEESFTGYGIGDNIVGAHSLIATIITTENKVVIFRTNNVTPNLDGSGFDLGSETLELPFFLNASAGECFPYEVFFTDVTVNCT